MTIDAATGVVSGTVPSGLSMASPGPVNGGSANALTYRGFRIRATDSLGTVANSGELIVQASDRVLPTLSFPPVTDAQVNVSQGYSPGVAGLAYADALGQSVSPVYSLVYNVNTGAAGTGDTVITAAAGKPAWITLSASTGLLTVSPPVGTAGRYRGLQVCVVDGLGYKACSAEVPVTVNNRPALAVTAPTVTDAPIGSAFTVQASVSGAFAAPTYTLQFQQFGSAPAAGSGEVFPASKPAWMTFDANAGTVSGTPPTGTATGLYRGMRIMANDTQQTAYSSEVTVRVR